MPVHLRLRPRLIAAGVVGVLGVVVGVVDAGKGYNIANIKEGDLDMPPLLPKPSDCDKCHGKPRLIIRDDDKEEVRNSTLPPPPPPMTPPTPPPPPLLASACTSTA